MPYQNDDGGGKEPVWTKIVIDQQNTSTAHILYIYCKMACGYSNGSERKINKFTHICGTKSKILKNKVQKETMLKFSKTAAVALLHSCGDFTIQKCVWLKVE